MKPETSIPDATWEAVVLGVANMAGRKGGSDERAERARRATHQLCGSFVSTETWQMVQDLMATPEPVLRIVVAVAQILTALVYSGTARDRMRRARLLNEVLKEAEAAAAERRAA